MKQRGGGGRRVTILDIARATGVSKSSVSRFLDEGSPSDTEAARLVRRVATELGYVRDVSAANLRRGSTGTIGVIVPRLTDTVMAMLYESLAHAAAQSGRFTIVATTNDDPVANQRAAEMLMARGVDGLVLATTRTGDGLAERLAAQGVRFVLALRTDGVHPSSVGDDRLGGYLATRHLIDLGHSRIGVVAGPSDASSAAGRVEGYRAAMDEAGLSVRPEWVVPSSFSLEAGNLAARELMTLADRPTALFAINDNTALGALSALAQQGLSVPGDISVVGYNDIPLVSHLPTPLTTVRTPFGQIAATAMELLTQADTPGAPAVRRATPSLIPRQSTRRL
ncbi:MAG: LacI family transcriptional regulator [Brevundimonas sp.]|uniref:LacI family transcriptional regulator n=1 Tax=Brevundimonas albigilva TaxID=1312364 RepID=A0ABY4SFT2_9CAUL|nr:MULTISPECIES: LacI family DNA-binding transcriptional regulator [Brevundimonas]MCV0416297.1 LacI family transcriptional regulator [Brevundimonas sp.]PZU61788.1 MAG: LacI family transcriptional regulator [Brevundimonas sp.]URI13895.1 LacI family transcriptional regulator [Brevundimonas albigilva]